MELLMVSVTYIHCFIPCLCLPVYNLFLLLDHNYVSDIEPEAFKGLNKLSSLLTPISWLSFPFSYKVQEIFLLCLWLDLWLVHSMVSMVCHLFLNSCSLKSILVISWIWLLTILFTLKRMSLVQTLNSLIICLFSHYSFNLFLILFHKLEY